MQQFTCTIYTKYIPISTHAIIITQIYNKTVLQITPSTVSQLQHSRPTQSRSQIRSDVRPYGSKVMKTSNERRNDDDVAKSSEVVASDTSAEAASCLLNDLSADAKER